MANLGALVVSLEANMAKFQSDMGKSAQVTQDAMTKMGLSSEQATKALKSLEAQASNAKSAALSLGKGLIIGAAAGMGFDAIKNKITGVIETMAHLKEVSEKTGSSVENLSKLAFLSKQAGSDIDSVANALAKMSKGMAGADNETKGAGLALSYLGISAKDAAGNLKDPGDMFMEVAKKLGEYKDGAGKAAVAQALFGKAGAEMLPTLKIMAEQGDIAAKVTTAQANAAQQYERDLKKLEVQQNMVFKTVAMALLPTMGDFTNAMIDASKNTNVLNKSAKDLAGDNSIGSWADSGAMGLARLIDVIVMIPKTLSAVSSSFKVVGADLTVLSKTTVVANPVEFAKKFIKGENPLAELNAAVQERNKIKADADAQYANLWNYDGSAMEKAMAARIANRGKATTTAGDPTKELNYNSAGEDGGMANKANDAAREAAKTAKNIFDGRLKDLDQGLAKEQSELEFANKYVAALHGQDVIDLVTYNDYRQKALESGIAITAKAYDGEIKLAEDYRDSLKKGSEKQAAQTKIDELKAKKDAAALDLGQQSKLLTLDMQKKPLDDFKNLKFSELSKENPIDTVTNEWVAKEAIIEAYRQTEFASDSEYYAKKEQNELEYAARVKQINQETADAKAASDMMVLTQAAGASDAMLSMLTQAGAQQSALGKAAFLTSKALAVAEIIMQTNVAAAKAEGQLGIFGLPMSTVIMATGYARAGMVAAMAIASAEGGYDIPAGTNPVTQLHEKEMVLPKGPADVIRGLAANGGKGGGGINVTYAPNIQIDGSTDMARNKQMIDGAVRQGNADLVDKLQRAGRI
jgi:hypothetical protein